MINIVKRKLKDNTGASLMVALLFFIVCAVVGSSILAAASSSMGRLKDIYETDQQRNTLSSAANLIAEKFGQEYDFSDFEETDNIKIVDLNGDQEGGKALQCSVTYTESGSGNAAVSFPAPSVKASASQTRNLEKFAKDYISKYITENWESSLTKVWDENEKKWKDWTDENTPNNRTVTDYKNTVSNYTKQGSYTFSLPGHTDDGHNNEIAAVDLYMDQYMNIEVHIYPYRKYPDTSEITFKNARQKYLVKIPAKAGEIQYEQIPVSSSTDANGNITRTIKRTITISDLGWDKAEIYTGALAEVERNAPEE